MSSRALTLSPTTEKDYEGHDGEVEVIHTIPTFVFVWEDGDTSVATIEGLASLLVSLRYGHENPPRQMWVNEAGTLSPVSLALVSSSTDDNDYMHAEHDVVKADGTVVPHCRLSTRIDGRA